MNHDMVWYGIISGGTRTRNLPLRRRTRYPLRHRDLLVIVVITFVITITNLLLLIKKVIIAYKRTIAATRDRTGDLQIFSLTLSQLSYSGYYFFLFK